MSAGRKKIGSKKGSVELMGDNVVRLLLAVVGILIIAYLLFRLITAITTNHDSEQAQSSLNILIGGINSKFTEVQIFGPSGWYITSFPAKTSIGKVSSMVARQCSDNGWKNCICVYKGDFHNPSVVGSADTVDFTGTCQQSDFVVQGTVINSASGFVNFIDKYLGITQAEVHLQNSIQINSPLPVTLRIDKNSKTISGGSSAGTPVSYADSDLQKILDAETSKVSSVQLSQPVSWFLDSFPMTVKNSIGKASEVPLPPQCSDAGWKSCLCICEYDFRGSSSCGDSNSVCVESDLSIAPVNSGTWSNVNEIFLNSPPINLEINYGDNTIARK